MKKRSNEKVGHKDLQCADNFLKCNVLHVLFHALSVGVDHNTINFCIALPIETKADEFQHTNASKIMFEKLKSRQQTKQSISGIDEKEEQAFL